MNLFRKLTALCLTAALTAGMVITAAADVSPVTATVNGKTATTSAFINSDWRTMVPVDTADAMGIAYTVQGDSVTFTANGISQTYTVGTAAGDTVPVLVDGEIYVPFYHLAEAFGYQVSWDSAAGTASAQKDWTLPTVADIASIQAITDMRFYGQGAAVVEVTYNSGVDLSGLSAQSYILEDRGSLTPDFGQLEIASVAINGQVATLTIADNTGATDANTLIYTGENPEGSRQRNAFGIYCTGAWYRGTDGVIYYGKQDTDEYKANTTGLGYQARETLELRLRHQGEPVENAACLANQDGTYYADGLWKETIDLGFGPGGLVTFEEAGIQIESTAKDAADGTADPYVRGYIYVPEDYTGQEAVPVVFTITGNGTSFWILEDGTNNFGTNVMYDAATTSWLGKGAIVVGIHDRSIMGKGGDDYDYVVDDVNVMKYILEHYNIDEDRIIIHGNSRSTMAASTIIQALAGQPYTTNQNAPEWGSAPRDHQLDQDVYDFNISVFLCNNGLLGGQGLWTQEDHIAVAKTGLRAWCFDAEQDFNNIDFAAELAQAYLEEGYDEAWLAENLRITCFPSELFYYWGETDHSTTRINYWYFADEPYYGPDCTVVDGQLVYGSKLQPGDTYTVQARGASRDGDKTGHAYTVYAEQFQEWALSN